MCRKRKYNQNYQLYDLMFLISFEIFNLRSTLRFICWRKLLNRHTRILPKLINLLHIYEQLFLSVLLVGRYILLRINFFPTPLVFSVLEISFKNLLRRGITCFENFHAFMEVFSLWYVAFCIFMGILNYFNSEKVIPKTRIIINFLYYGKKLR